MEKSILKHPRINPKIILACTLFFVTSFFSTLQVSADISGVTAPPNDAGGVIPGEVVTLTFTASYSGSTDSRVIISTSFDPSAWSYEGFTVTMGGDSLSVDFIEEVGSNSVSLRNDDITPDEGIFVLNLEFKSLSGGNYFFDWAAAFSILAGSSPDIQTVTRTTNVTVSLLTSKAETSISLSFNPSKIDIGQAEILTLMADLSPQLPGKVITFYYWYDEDWKIIAGGETDENGEYVYSWDPSPDLGEGIYRLKARFDGDDEYLATESTSDPIYLEVIPEFKMVLVPLSVAILASFIIVKRPFRGNFTTNTVRLTCSLWYRSGVEGGRS